MTVAELLENCAGMRHTDEIVMVTEGGDRQLFEVDATFELAYKSATKRGHGQKFYPNFGEEYKEAPEDFLVTVLHVE